MEKKPTRTFKTALKNIRRDQKISLQELGFRIDSDASHIFKMENGHDVTLSTVLRVADALNVSVQFGQYTLTLDPLVKKRLKKIQR
jgi:transcriptional regulator with XRE-family HTH domain